jgi:hypothetical protein
LHPCPLRLHAISRKDRRWRANVRKGAPTRPDGGGDRKAQRGQFPDRRGSSFSINAFFFFQHRRGFNG